MSETRARRVGEQIKKEVSRIIAEEIKDPRLHALTSVTDVQITRDLRYARIYVSIYGQESEKENTLETLHRATGFIRGEIGQRIRLRYVPEISFHLDSSLDYGAHIEQVIKKMRNNREKETP